MSERENTKTEVCKKHTDERNGEYMVISRHGNGTTDTGQIWDKV